MQLIERTKSGVTGFDELIEQGIPRNDLILLSGTCGSGKTVFGLEYILSMAESEHGIYVSFEEGLDKIRRTAMNFGWDIDALEKSGKIKLLKYDPFQMEDIIELIDSNIRQIGAKRIVIDSISAIGVYVKDSTELRRMILQISDMLRKNECTSVLISEVVSGNNFLSRFGVEEFVTDGVVLLHNVLIAGEYRRGVSIWKMRSTNHSKKVHPYKITDNGFVVYPSDTISFGLKKM